MSTITTEPTTEPTTGPATEPTTGPATESTTEPTTEPVVDGSREPAYHVGVVVAAALVMPALWLVADGNLSVDGALLRFACALVAAGVGVHLVRQWLPGSEPAPSDGVEPVPSGSSTPIGG